MYLESKSVSLNGLSWWQHVGSGGEEKRLVERQGKKRGKRERVRGACM